MASLYRLWRGELALADAFWNWAVFGGILVNLATTALFLAFAANGMLVLAFIAGYLPSIPYNVLVVVGVWRSAERYEGDRRRADLARFVTIAGMILLSIA